MNVLKIGATGADVQKLQTALNRAGSNLTIDGSFGEKTRQAVRNFQEDNGLTVDGVVGEKTWAKLAPFLTDYSAIVDVLEKCLSAVEQLPEFKQLEKLLYG